MGGAFSEEVRCEACGKVIDSVPFRCRYCGGVFCVYHHLPENHSCPALPLIRQPRAEKMFALPYPARRALAAEEERAEPVKVLQRLGEERRVRIPVSGASALAARVWRRVHLPKISWSIVLAVLAAAALIILFSTVFQRGTLPQPATAPLFEPLTVGEILRNPSLYMGRVVRVEGVVGLSLSPLRCVDEESGAAVYYVLVDGVGHTIPLVPTERTFLSAFIGSFVEVEGMVKKVSCSGSERPAIVAYKVYSRAP
ncbi:MAG: zinc finger AN1 domain-containing stress-associated protein [Thermofilaceae archaeon]